MGIYLYCELVNIISTPEVVTMQSSSKRQVPQDHKWYCHWWSSSRWENEYTVSKGNITKTIINCTVLYCIVLL